MKDDPVKNAAALKELLKEDANKHCADCGQLGTRWASWNIGVFLCIRCGGLHRTLGTHISKIKSVTLDKWTDEQVESMRMRGNARVNALLNPNPDRFPFPSFAGDQQQYIKDKYEKKLFSGTSYSPRMPTGTQSNALGAEPLGVRSYSSEIRTMREMGFMDAEACLTALKRTNGNVNAAVDILFAKESGNKAENTSGEKQPAKPSEPTPSIFVNASDDPWAKFDSSSQGGKGGVAPPVLEDPFADWK